MNAGAARPAPAREAWERRTAVPLVVVGVAFIVAYSVFVLAPELPLAAHSVLLLFLLVVWAVFFVDIVVRIALTPRGGRWRFAVTHPVDLLSALIPLFRAFRVLTGALRHQGPGGREASPPERGDAPGGEGHGER